ncbi:hypothetical protein B7C42_00065 [Nocardia cerradoensis]|uniref:Uncharacterized protein n=1 Tax=Nocardia cerradoensis TaxID=85688 RepID=A0A231HDJ2_9NOCA|nr:hypothetical protein B7C42_00065 [Nocardia cerradoensis]
MTSETWFPPADDVHLRIWLGDMVFDYAVSAVVVHNLIEDWSRRRWCTIEFMRDTAEKRLLPRRLPCERLFLGP